MGNKIICLLHWLLFGKRDESRADVTCFGFSYQTNWRTGFCFAPLQLILLDELCSIINVSYVMKGNKKVKSQHGC